MSEQVRDGTPEQRLRTAVPAPPKTHSSNAAVREQSAFNGDFFQPWAKFQRVGSRVAESSFKSTSTHAMVPAMSSIAVETLAVHSR